MSDEGRTVEIERVRIMPGELEVQPSPAAVPSLSGGDRARVRVTGVFSLAQHLETTTTAYATSAQHVADKFPVLIDDIGECTPEGDTTTYQSSFGNGYGDYPNVTEVVAKHRTAVGALIALLGTVHDELRAVTNALACIAVEYPQVDESNAEAIRHAYKLLDVSDPAYNP